ncbi:ATP-dependent DNA helicase RecG [Oxalobacter sp. OttesenSCG-928-P03]|nr:ATP-dependent DNA helicase RecG [Oxalobacter sp. OttesenSCG-928-P03]
MSSKKPKTRASRLERLGLRSDMDFVLHLPMRYEDETRVVPIREAQFMTGSAQVEGVVMSSGIQYRPRRQLVVSIADETGELFLRFLHFYASQLKQLAVGSRVRVRGELRQGFFGGEMVHPAYRVVAEGTPLPAALTPVYPSTEGISQTQLRKEIAAAMARVNLQDTLPDTLLMHLNLPVFADAIRLLHNPPPDVDEHALAERTHPAWQRVKFDELLAQQLSMKRAHTRRRQQIAPQLSASGDVTRGLLEALPFILTAEQSRVVAEISESMQKPYPMQRLLQGDVGSGKTVVAAMAAAQAIDSGTQVAMMAPTEILADQHFQRVAEWMAPLGVDVAWLTGGMKKKDRQSVLSRIASGKARLVIGTHALIQDEVHFDSLGLVIVDEQHRFGVGQRLMLRNKGESGHDSVPHQLMMSATPIPRTLAMTYYADLDVSVINELPPGRTPVITRLIDRNRRDEVIKRIHAAALSGRQIYWVCPLIEESETLQLQTAVETHAALKEALPDLNVGLVHGRLRQAEKQAVMDAFAGGEIHLLVATTVIEVGVDVPNASLMIIEHAERFGLSQLHQLRGRVGRGDAESICLLLYQAPLGETAKQRLMTMRETSDGFAIARRDLEIRGPGEFLGARQSGVAMLRFADLQKDADLIEASQDMAQALLDEPGEAAQAIVESHLNRWLGGFEDFLKA